MPDDDKPDSELEPKDQDTPAAEDGDQEEVPDPHDFDEPEPLADHRVKEGDEDEAKDDSDDKEPEWPEELLELAEDLGLDEDEAKEFGTPAKLSKVLDKLEKQSEAAKKADAVPPPPSKEPDDADKEPDKKEDFKIKLSEELFEPELVDVINGLNDHVVKIKKLEEGLAKVLDYFESRAKAEADSAFDGMIESLGAEWEDHFGKGPSSQISKRTKVGKNRLAVREEIEVLTAGYKARGKDVPAVSELFQRALRGLFNEQIEAIAGEKTRKKAKKRQSQFMSRPTYNGNNALEGDATALAVANVARMMAQKGISQFGTPDEF